MNKRRKTTAITVTVAVAILGYFSTKPTGGMYFDGEPTAREINARVLDAESRPVEGVTVEHVYSRGFDVMRTEYKPGSTDADGRIAIPMLLGGDSGSEFEYAFGLAKYSESGRGRVGWRLLWGLVDLRGAELRSTVLFRGENGSKAQVPEANLAQLPVNQRIPLSDSVIKSQPNIARFCRNGMVDVSSFVVMIVPPKNAAGG